MERLRLMVKEVRPVERVGARQLPRLSFLAADGRTYETFRTTLFEALQGAVGREIEADVETHERGNFVNRHVREVYLGGMAVGERKKQARGESPEARASIEAQCAFKGVVDLVVAGRLELEGRAGQLALAYAIGRLSSALPAEVVTLIGKRRRPAGKDKE